MELKWIQYVKIYVQVNTHTHTVDTIFPVPTLGPSADNYICFTPM